MKTVKNLSSAEIFTSCSDSSCSGLSKEHPLDKIIIFVSVYFLLPIRIWHTLGKCDLVLRVVVFFLVLFLKLHDLGDRDPCLQCLVHVPVHVCIPTFHWMFSCIHFFFKILLVFFRISLFFCLHYHVSASHLPALQFYLNCHLVTWCCRVETNLSRLDYPSPSVSVP